MAIISTDNASRLNSFSVTGVLGSLWDDVQKTFSSAVDATGKALSSQALNALADANNKLNASTQQSKMPTVPVSASLDTKTMAFIAVAGIAAIYLLKGK